MKGTNTWECMSFRHHAVLKKQIRCLSDLSQGVVCSVVLLDDANSMLKANSAAHADAKFATLVEQRRAKKARCCRNAEPTPTAATTLKSRHVRYIMSVFGPHVTGGDNFFNV